MARLLLEESVGSDPRELEGSVRRLRRRWHQQEARKLSGLISEAERSGDQEQLARLLEEKAVLSRKLHRQTPTD